MLTRWNPFDELTDLHREVDRLFGWTRGEAPARPTEGPGCRRPRSRPVRTAGICGSRCRASTRRRSAWTCMATRSRIKGERSENTRDAEMHVSEIRYGRFERTFALPAKVEAEKVTANYRNGMLELALPLAESAKPRRIEIGGGEAKAIVVEKVA